DVPEGDVVQQGLELVLERVEADREVHVVVDRVALRSVLLRRLEVRRATVACTALHETHVERLSHGPLLGRRRRATRGQPTGVPSFTVLGNTRRIVRSGPETDKNAG